MTTVTFTDLAQQLAETGRRLDERGWVLGTSGNFSAVRGRDPLRLVITPSGVSKGSLTGANMLEVDEHLAVTSGAARPSAEARLHIELVRARGAGAILHTHSVWSTVVSDRHACGGGVLIEGYEMLKGLQGVTTHRHREWIPIIPNDQDMDRLAHVVGVTLSEYPDCHGFLLQRHGLYTWGKTLPQALRHIEILEFLLEVVGRTGGFTSHGDRQDTR